MAKKTDKATMRLLKSHLSYGKKQFDPERILLFGSRARGDHLAGSDVDVIIISKRFKGMDFRERIIKAYGLWDKREGLDVLG